MNIFTQGSNQYEKRILGIRQRTAVDVAIFSVMILFAATLGKTYQDSIVRSPIAESGMRVIFAQEHATPTPSVTKPSPTVIPTATPSPTPTIDPQAEKSQLQADIEAYMKTIFGPEFRVARAVSHNECNPANKKYPECVLHTSAEYSVGLFQINLYNAKQWVHAGRIPGSTMEEKVEWLKDPYNNTLYAYWLWSKSTWAPWTAYTSGNYKRSL